WVKSNAPWPKTETKVRTVVEASTFKITDKDRGFWAFQPVKLASGGRQPPVGSFHQGADAPRSPVDCFILEKLHAAGLQPSPRADKATLLRRVSFDLTGLPPTPEDLEAFLQDDSPQAFERVVDRLLASPHYGERWARHWLDVARYG